MWPRSEEADARRTELIKALAVAGNPDERYISVLIVTHKLIGVRMEPVPKDR
jgi:hypothetical protein